MKNYVVTVDVKYSTDVYVEAASKDEAASLVLEKLKKNDVDMRSAYVIDYDIYNVEEEEDELD